jgi:hypothetical protein
MEYKWSSDYGKLVDFGFRDFRFAEAFSLCLNAQKVHSYQFPGNIFSDMALSTASRRP